jgi:hypothetical protein
MAAPCELGEKHPILRADAAHVNPEVEIVDVNELPHGVDANVKLCMGKRVFGVALTAAVMMLGAGLGFSKIQQPWLGTSFTPVERDNALKNLTRNGFCKGSNIEVNMSQLSDPTYLGADKPWPEPTCAAAFTSLSKCLTMLPCTPDKLDGVENIRTTYEAALERPTVLQSYMEYLLNSNLMADLEKSTNGCNSDGFAGTVSQLQIEVMALQRTAGYYGKMTVLVDALGDTMQRLLQQNLEVLLEESQKVTTTTTTLAEKKGWKIFKDVLSISTDVLSAAGACMGVPGLGDAINHAGQVITAAAATATTVSGITSSSRAIHKNKHSTGTATSQGQGASNPGAGDDNALDTESVNMMQTVSKMTDAWQKSLSLQREIITKNYGRLMVALPVYASCELGEEEIQEAIAVASPIMDWFSLSLVLPQKYNIFMQRGYNSPEFAGGTEEVGVSCTSQQCSPGSLPGGCYSVESGYRNTNYIPVAQDNNPNGGRGFLPPTSHYLWLGEVDNPTSGPPASFWQYLLREDGPVVQYLVKQTGFKMPSKAKSAAANDCKDCCLECQALSEVLLSQCSLSPKTYIPSGSVAAGSLLPTHCKVFDAPWVVSSLADCGGKSVMNNFYCTTASGVCGYQPIANFNTQVFVPKKKNNYAIGAEGLVGCCQPGSDAKQFHCDFPVCDCPSLAAIKELVKADAGGSIGNWLLTDDSIWWGKCNEAIFVNPASGNFQSQIDTDYTTEVEDEEGMGDDDVQIPVTVPLTMTSLGVSWQFVYENYDLLKELSQDLKAKGLQDYQKIITAQQGQEVLATIAAKINTGIASCTQDDQCNQMNEKQMCMGGGGAQNCDTCKSTQCSNWQCACNGD